MKSEQLIKNLIKIGEGEQLEFQEMLHNEAVGKVICSFLNNKGGQVLIGVKNNGEAIGLANARQVAKDLGEYLIKEIVPEAPISVSLEQFGEKQIIAVKVSSASKKPYVFGGSIFYRMGASTSQASSKEISELIHNRQQTETRWERQICLGVSSEDLDLEEINKTIEASIYNGRTKESKKEVVDFLKYYGLYQDGNFTNATVVLFAKDPSRFIPQCRVRVAVFPSTKTGSRFAYDKTFEGSIFKNATDIEEFFDVNVGTSSAFKIKKWLREDRLNYPKEALREALLNALIHRDYSNVSGSVLIAFYSDRLEISSYGSLPKEITVAALKRSHLSLPVNPDIAQICFLRGWIEKIGRGTQKIIEQCSVLGFKEPIWISKGNVMTITFPGITVVTQKNNDKRKEKIDGVNDVVINGVTDGVTDGVINGVSDGVINELIKVVKAIDNKPGVIAEEIAIIIKKAKPSVERYIKILRIIGLVEFKGAPKTGGYYLTAGTAKKIENK